MRASAVATSETSVAPLAMTAAGSKPGCTVSAVPDRIALTTTESPPMWASGRHASQWSSSLTPRRAFVAADEASRAVWVRTTPFDVARRPARRHDEGVACFDGAASGEVGRAVLARGCAQAPSPPTALLSPGRADGGRWGAPRRRRPTPVGARRRSRVRPAGPARRGGSSPRDGIDRRENAELVFDGLGDVERDEVGEAWPGELRAHWQSIRHTGRHDCRRQTEEVGRQHGPHQRQRVAGFVQ